MWKGGGCVDNIYFHWVTMIENLDTTLDPFSTTQHNRKRASALNVSISAVTYNCYIDGKKFMYRMH